MGIHSLEIDVGYKKLRRFLGTQVNLSVLLKKPDIAEVLVRNLSRRISLKT